MEDEMPLLGSTPKSKSLHVKRIFVGLTIFILAVSLVAIIVVYVPEQFCPVIPIPTPTPNSDDYDFPLSPPLPWDITNGHTRNLTFITSEGTWINVDKYNQNLLFDILGDIYVLPQDGGNASLLIGGVAFDTQARFSPDGNYISYTSDLSGCDNIWVMDLSTSSTWQVTDEDYHWVSNGQWNPDGNSIIAVKWYTSSRSIGAGELWVYSIDYTFQNPSTGARLIGRNPGDQVGPEEPIYSPDGNYVYYSKNTMDSPTNWNYNKDPHRGIYSIFSFNLNTNETTYITGGPGGAARPIPSPSGNYLAFIKRAPLFETSLIVRELETGNEVLIYDNLEQDLQESTGATGVYPNFVWSDENNIIIWTKGGKIVEVSVNSGNVSEIPFTVQISLDLAPTVRFKNDIQTNTSFMVKVISWPIVSVMRQNIVFNALGYTYIQSFPPRGIPTIVSDPTQYSTQPSFSQNGNLVIHTNWNDISFGNVEIVDFSLSRTRSILTTSPGRYTNAKISPDSNFVLWKKLSGDSLSGSMYSADPGIYIANLVFGNGKYSSSNITKISSASSGDKAWFSADSSGIYLMKGSYPSLTLGLMNIKTRQTTNLAVTKYGTEIVISPNNKWIAWIEFRNIYVAPFILPGDGKPMEVSFRSTPDNSTITPGVIRCSQMGGDFLSWCENSMLLRWATGPILYEFNVTGYMQCPSCYPIPGNMFDLGFNANTGLAETYVVLDNVTLITMEAADNLTIPNAKIVVHGDKIEDLGPRDLVPNPPDAEVLNLDGALVFPGFIDAHAHWNVNDFEFYVQQNWQFLENLAFGVTTMHNPSADSISVAIDIELVRSGRKLGPRLFSTGSIIYGAGGSLHCDVGSVDDAISWLSQLKAYGFWSAKSYNQPSRSARQQILEAASELNMNIVPEGGMHFYWNLNQIIDGHTTIEHSLPVAPLYEDVIQLFAQSGTAYTPTLIVNYGGIQGERYFYEHTNIWEDITFMNFAPQQSIIGMTMRRTKAASDLDYHHFQTAASAKKIFEAGGLIEAGAHGQMQGLGLHWEMALFSNGNLSNYDVLQTATINPAKALGLDDQIGSLAKGKLADLVIFKKENNPLLDIHSTSKVYMVMKDGRLYDAATLTQILPVNLPLPPGPPLDIPFVSKQFGTDSRKSKIK